MNNYFMPILRNDPVLQIERVKLTKNNIKIDFVNSRESGTNYMLNFLVNLNDNSIIHNGYDKNTLLPAIKEYFGSKLEYFTIKSYNSNSIVLLFNYPKWIIDAFKGQVKINFNFMTFTKKMWFKRELPELIKYYCINGWFKDFIVRKIKDHLVKAKKDNFIEKFLPKFLVEKVKKGISYIFDYDYDFSANIYKMSIKPQFVFLFLYSVSQIKKKNEKDYILFDQKVINRLKDYEKNNKKDVPKKTLF